MRLTLMRHGQAASPDNAGVNTDAERPLTPRGHDDARRAAAFLNQQGTQVDVLFVSPLKRAQQTAKEVSEKLGSQPKIQTYLPLDNSMQGVDLFRKLMEDHGSRPEIMLVGHQPQLGEMAEHLTGRFFNLQPAGIIVIETDGNEKKLLWSANPDEFSS